MKRRIKVILVLLLGMVLLCGIGVKLYLADYYRAQNVDLAALEQEVQADGHIEISEREDEILFLPDDPTAGLIFYPGGKVEAEAYAPLMESLMEQGILCVICRMPGNLAVLDMNAADGIIERYPQVDDWYIGGHSLGGVMAASYASKHSEELSGVILLAAYTTTDISDSGLKVLSIRGTEDGVMDSEAYEKNRGNVPSDMEEIILEGGCHAYFGTYGEQDGDGEASITPEEQQSQTVDAITRWIRTDLDNR